MSRKIIVVTGSNKGIGKAVVQRLLKEGPPALIYLTSRNEDLGRAALEEVKKVESKSQVEWAQLDISDNASIQKLAKELKEKHGKIQILVNNAGIATKGSAFDSDIVRNTLRTNYEGTKQMVLAFLPLVEERIVNVSSMASKLGSLKSDALRARFRSDLSLDQCDALMQEFQVKTAVDEGKHSEQWPSAAYSVSKMGVTAMTRTFARENPNLLINACCPGYVDTDMSSHKGHLTPEQGAETILKVAIGNIGKQTGLFWENSKPSEW